MNYLRVFYIVLTSCMVSCSSIKNQKESSANIISIDEQLFRNGVLHVDLPEIHPNSFAIKTPDGTWFVLQDSEDNIQILPQSDFDKIRKLEFQLQDMKGVTWRYSIKSTEIIFNESGQYLIYFANNLETEPENTYNIQALVYFSK